MRVLVEIVRHGSLVRAAQALHVTQAAVSKSMRELETELGTQLLVRSRKGAWLTSAGQRFHAHAMDCLLNHGRAIASVRSDQGQPDDLRIGTLPTTAGSIVPAALAEFYRENASGRVQVRSGSYESLVAALRASELDLIIGRAITRDIKGLGFEALYREDVALVTRHDHPLRHLKMLSQSDLDQVPVIVPLPGTSVRAAVEDFLFVSGLRLGPLIFEVQSSEFAYVMTKRHSALWFTPVGLVEEFLGDGSLGRLDIQHMTLQATIGLTTRANDALDGSAKRFADILRKLTLNKTSALPG